MPQVKKAKKRTVNKKQFVANKPPYVLLTMKDVRRIPFNGYKVASTFSGGGGSSLGYRMAGFKVVWANEFIEEAAKTYKANNPSTVVDQRDIRKIRGEDIYHVTGIKRGELDLFDGSPPCAVFSSAGKQEQHWNVVKKYSNKHQRVDDLFYEYIRLIDEIRPKVFIAENVTGLVKGVAKGYFIDILKRFRDLGYNTEARIINAASLGVPQARERIIFMGVDEKYKVPPLFPTPLPYTYTVIDAVPDVLQTCMDVQKAYPIESLVGYQMGRDWDDLKVGVPHEKHFNLIRVDPFKPCPTVMANQANSIVHPYQKRRFTIKELKAICSFPIDYVLTGDYAKQAERLGRAVPPLMMKSIALCAKKVLDEINSKKA